MNAGAENRRKTILAGGLGAVALCCVLYGYNALYGGAGPAPAGKPVVEPSGGGGAAETVAVARGNPQPAATPAAGSSLGIAAGVAAKKMASTSSSLDPTLDERAMLRTENLVYTGTGRNIFSATYVPPVAIPKSAPPARPQPAIVAPVVPPGPPPPPPINLKFFGIETLSSGKRQAFLLQGEDVYLASEGDIVARRYKIVSIQANTVKVQDLANQSTQSLPLQMN
jgi:hypothetical protein